MQARLVRAVGQDVLFERVVAELPDRKYIFRLLTHGRTGGCGVGKTYLGDGGPVLLPERLRELLLRLAGSREVLSQPSLADLRVRLGAGRAWGRSDGVF